MERQRVAGLFFIALHLVAGVGYLVWLALRLNLHAWYVSVPFLVAEVLSLMAVTYFASTIRHPRQHERAGIGGMPPELSLDVWIATAREPIDVLERTVEAVTRLRCRERTLYILDDGESDDVARLARKYGCRYIRRHEHDDAKSGNLNYALERSTGDLILVLDADQIPDPRLLEHVGGYFRIPEIGFVQTAQRYVLPPGDPWGNAERLFYDVIQRSKDADNAAFSCGSGVVYRRAALDSIGGFSTWNLVEDVHTSMRLHARGWRSVYHGYGLSRGTAPADIVGYVRQRRQWAVDSLRMLFWDNPLRHRGLSGAQKLQYGYTAAAYLIAGFLVPFYFVLPIWSTVTRDFVSRAPAWEYGIVRGVYLLCTCAMLLVLEKPIRSLKSYRFWAGLFPTFMMAAVSALRARTNKPAYRVTSKVQERPLFRSRLATVWPQVLVLLLVAIVIPWGWATGRLPADAMAVNTAWSLWTMWTLYPITVQALRRHPAAAGGGGGAADRVTGAPRALAAEGRVAVRPAPRPRSPPRSR
jgi:cellulose synthase (UDP-forming)